MEGISGKKREGFAGIIIKDTWTINSVRRWKREGGGECWSVDLGWGEKAKTYT